MVLLVIGRGMLSPRLYLREEKLKKLHTRIGHPIAQYCL